MQPPFPKKTLKTSKKLNMSYCFLQRPFDDVAVAKDVVITDMVYLDFVFHRHVCDISVGALGRGPQVTNVVYHQTD